MTSKNLPLALYEAAQVRALDRLAIEQHGIAGYTLMTRAGQAALECLLRHWPEAQHLCVVCGLGNNGGDGYVLARLARERGISVDVIQVGDARKLQGDARQARDHWERAGGQVHTYDSSSAAVFGNSDIIVDAVFGTGLQRAVEGEWRSVLEQINASDRPVLAMDIPSGLDSDTGTIMGIAVPAEVCISFIGLKRGMFTGSGRDYCGEIEFSDLQVPAEIYTQVVPDVLRLDENLLAEYLPVRKASSHKGLFGHVLVIGGDQGMSGAVRMAAEAAARSGAGLVSVATRAAHAAQISSIRPELMCHAVESAHELRPLLKRANVIAIGPGLGQSAWGQMLLAEVLQTAHPLVVDADALNLLAREPGWRSNWILTPHPGEAARLAGTNTTAIQQDRFTSVVDLADRYGGVMVLKGSGSLIHAQGNSITWLCDRGNPGMAGGGMGDVLTGIIAGLLAQDLDLEQAARCGVLMHALAADATARAGMRGMLASDLLAEIRKYANPG